jgi:hypothetical protein
VGHGKLFCTGGDQLAKGAGIYERFKHRCWWVLVAGVLEKFARLWGWTGKGVVSLLEGVVCSRWQGGRVKPLGVNCSSRGA